MNRRQLLRNMFWGSSALAVGGIAQLGMIRSALASQQTEFDDYKALVCVMLLGGNDSLNMIVPTGTGSTYNYQDYEFARGGITVANNSMNLADYYSAQTLIENPYASGSSASAYTKGYINLANLGNDLGVNSIMPELADLLSRDQMTLLANTGNLIAPISKDDYLSKTAPTPPFLFAHNHQQRAMFTGWGDNLDAFGWAGRLADSWLKSGVNNGSPLGLNISYSGDSHLLQGAEYTPLVLPTGNIPLHYGLLPGSRRRETFENLNGQPSEHYFKALFKTRMMDSLQNMEAIESLWNDAGDAFGGVTDSYGQTLFSQNDNGLVGLGGGYNNQIIGQLEAVAKMISIGSDDQSLGYAPRQIFYVTLGGFDTHAGQANKHPGLLRGLSLALDKFNRAMNHLGLNDKVATFTMSDFGRTVRVNGDGTDHAWGSHSLVMGGPASGGLSGDLPNIDLGGDDDVSGKGRILPTMAQDQVNATLTNWFGVEDELIRELFPNIDNFKTNSSLSSAFVNL